MHVICFLPSNKLYLGSLDVREFLFSGHVRDSFFFGGGRRGASMCAG